MYERGGNNVYVTRFAIMASPSIDGVSVTDGIDVTTQNLGPAFPHGVFVAQDNTNDGSNQNYKLVPLQFIIGNLSTKQKHSRAPSRHMQKSAASARNTYLPFISQGLRGC